MRVQSASYQISVAIQTAIKDTSPQVKSFASPLIKQTYGSVPDQITEPHTGALMNVAAKSIRASIGSILQVLPDGEHYVRRLPRTTLASYISGKDKVYTYTGKFTPNKTVLGTWAWAIYPEPKKNLRS